MGVQCHSGTVQPVFRSPLFQNGVFQANSNSPNSSPNELGLGSPASAGLVATNGSTAFHHLNGSANNSSIAPSPVHLHHQLNAASSNHQSNGLGLSSGLSNGSNNREHNAGKLHNSMMRSLNNSNNNSLAPVLLDYFPATGNDGLNISWAHGVNNRARLNHALSSEFA